MIDKCQKENSVKWKQWLNKHKNNCSHEEAKGDRFVGTFIPFENNKVIICQYIIIKHIIG